MKKNNILFFFEVCIYLVQIFFMLSFSKYMHSKILYNVFLFSLCYNILLVSFFLGIISPLSMNFMIPYL